MASATRQATRALELDKSAMQTLVAQRGAMQTALDDALATVTALRLDLQSVDVRIDALQAGIKIQRSAIVQRTLASFPTELLRAVFAILVQEPDELWPENEAGKYNFQRASTPFRLSAVCRRWRGVALASPELWTYVGLPVIAPRRPRNLASNQQRAPRLYRYVQTVLERSHVPPSASYPLHLMLDWLRGAAWTDVDNHQAILDAIGLHSRRWLRIHLRFPWNSNVDDMQIFRRSTPLLEEFYARCSAEDTMLPWTESSPVYLPDCPRLRHIDDQRLFIHPTQPWPTITFFSTSVQEISLSLLWDFLRFMPSLITLRVDFSDMSDDAPQPPNPAVELSSLTSLGASGLADVFPLWLSGLHLPRMTELLQSSDFLNSFASSYDALSDKITSLVVYIRWDDAPVMAAAAQHLQRLDRVRHLTLLADEDVGGEHVEGSFFRDVRSRDLCWRDLQSVTLKHVALGDSAAADFIDFVRSRAAESEAPFGVHMLGATLAPSWFEGELLAIAGAACTIAPEALQASLLETEL